MQSRGETPLRCPQPPGGWYRGGRARILVEGHCKRTRGAVEGQRCKMHQEKFRQDIRKKSLSGSGRKWQRLPRETMGSPSLETFIFSLTLFSSRTRPPLPECFIWGQTMRAKLQFSNNLKLSWIFTSQSKCSSVSGVSVQDLSHWLQHSFYLCSGAQGRCTQEHVMVISHVCSPLFQVFANFFWVFFMSFLCIGFHPSNFPISCTIEAKLTCLSPVFLSCS